MLAPQFLPRSVVNLLAAAYNEEALQPDGSNMGYQAKIYLYIADTNICSPEEGVGVFDTDFGKLGINICYEGMFPEIARLMALQIRAFDRREGRPGPSRGPGLCL